jgi:hypothetical protein
MKLEDNGQRRSDMTVMISLYNHQVESIGMNQLLSTFMPDISAERRYFQQNVVIDETGHDFLEQLHRT